MAAARATARRPPMRESPIREARYPPLTIMRSLEKRCRITRYAKSTRSSTAPAGTRYILRIVALTSHLIDPGNDAHRALRAGEETVEIEHHRAGPAHLPFFGLPLFGEVQGAHASIAGEHSIAIPPHDLGAAQRIDEFHW